MDCQRITYSFFYYLIVTLLTCAVLNADNPSFRLAPEAEPLALVHGCVNVITGDFVQHETDMGIDGTFPLHLSRTFDSGATNAASPIGHGFTWAIARAIDSVGFQYVYIEDREGVQLPCFLKFKKGPYQLHPDIFEKGYTNYSPFGIDATNSLHNVTLKHHSRRKPRDDLWIVTLGCGTKRFYQKKLEEGSRWWYLSKEIRANGNRAFYDFDQEGKLRKIWLTDSSESTPLVAYSVDYKGNDVVVNGTDGKSVRYIVKKNSIKIKRKKSSEFRLAKVEADHLIPVSYHYPEKGTFKAMGKLEWVVRPDGRTLRIEYDYKTGKVLSLTGPVGETAEPIKFATFTYSGKIREWKGPQGELTKYLVDERNRISKIEKYTDQGKTLSHRQQFYWGTNGNRKGNLLAKALCTPAGEACTSTYLVYDDRGNVTRETFLGNITGAGRETHLLNQVGEPQAPVEGYAIQRSYLPVFNLVQEEIGDDGSYTEYRYKEGTNLLIAKLQGKPKRFARDFFSYDQYAYQVRHIIDNGSGVDLNDFTDVTVRTIHEVDPITTPLSPAFGRPKEVRKKYWEKGQEIPLRTVRYQYDDHGYPTQEEHYDAQGQYRYTLQRLYNAAGKILEETNPIGQKTRHDYDANGNRTLTYLVDQGIQIEYQYDLCNRLIKETEIHPHANYITTHRYDLSSRKIATVDPFQNQTLYEYNDLNRVVKIIHRAADGQTAIEQFEYDFAGNKTAVHDVLGHMTRTSYTARNQPICISHPDSSRQTYRYNSNGSVAKETASNGVTTITYYDPCLRPARKSYHDADGNYLYDTLATFQGNHLSTETDAIGVMTHYRYDGAGRLIETTKGTERTQHAYDSLGRQYKTIEWADETTARMTIRTYDNLDRVIEECVEDQEGTLFSQHHYGYDCHGNRHLEQTQTSQGLARTETEYDTRHRPIRTTDALGHITIITHEEEFATGITTTTTTDPLSNQSITVQNSLGQITKKLRKDAQGNLCAYTEFFYDLAGRKIRQCDRVIAEGYPDSTITTEWTYDSMGRVLTLTEAYGTPEQRATQHIYNSKGQKECTILPDGVRLNYLYDILGRLKSYTASDQSFYYLYEYDLNANVTQITDQLTHTTTQRQYDQNNRVIREILANGQALDYTYDGLGRPLKVILPDQTNVKYRYDACNLKAVIRPNYRHEYTSYDLTGNLLEELTPIGEVSYTWDLLSRPREIRSAHFTETIPEEGYDPVGNLLEKTRQDYLCTTSSSYAYNPLYQLRSEITTGGIPQQYIYDSLYNRRQQNGQEQAVNPLNQLTQAGNTIYHYDKRGNLIAEQTLTDRTEYRYDALNRLTWLLCNGEQYHYLYDPFNRRIKKTGPNLEENYLYIDQKEIGLIQQGKITQLRILGQGKGAEIGAAIALELDDQVYIPIHDQAGNVVLLIDLCTNSLADAYIYSAFGEEQRYGPGARNPWHFSSKRLDPETGWIYFGRRYYNPTIGRWTTPDPIGFADGPNLYAYVRNNPLTHFDEYGLLIGTLDNIQKELDRTEPPGPSPAELGKRLFFHPRVQGGIQAMGGLRDAYLGGLLLLGTGPSGVGAAIGCAAIAYGLDHYYAGMTALFSGQSTSTMTVKGLQSAGVPPTAAHLTDSAIGIAATMGANTLLKTNQIVTTSVVKSPCSNTTTVIGETAPVAKTYKPFTKSYYRENLIEFTGVNPGKAADAHHVFPQKYREKLLKKDINIDEPQYLTWWPTKASSSSNSHQMRAREYGIRWEEFMKTEYDAASKEQILEFGRTAMNGFEFKVNY